MQHLKARAHARPGFRSSVVPLHILSYRSLRARPACGLRHTLRMTTASLLLFGLFFLLTSTALALSSVALMQTKALWSALKRHESECRSTDEELFRELRKQFESINKVQQDILTGISRLEGIDEAQRRITQGGVRKHGT